MRILTSMPSTAATTLRPPSSARTLRRSLRSSTPTMPVSTVASCVLSRSTCSWQQAFPPSFATTSTTTPTRAGRASPTWWPSIPTTPTPPCAAPSSCASSWTKRGWIGTPLGTSSAKASLTPTTPCCPRRSRSGRSRPSASSCRACTCTSTRSTAVTWSPSRVRARAGRTVCATPPSSGTVRCAWQTSRSSARTP